MSKTAPGISLRTKLIIAMAAVALTPLLITNYFTFLLTEEELIKTAFERNQALAEKVAGEIDQMFAEKIRMLKIAADDPNILSMNPAQLVSALKPLPDHHPELLMAIALAPNGDLLARSDGRQVQANYLDRDYFHTAVATGETTISDVLVSKTTGKLDIGIAEPIMNPDQTLLGMIVIGVSLEKIIETINKTRIGATGYAFIVNQDGTVLIHPDPDLIVNGRDFSDLPPVRAAISARTGSLEYTFQKTRMLAGYSIVPATGWGLIVQQPLEEALGRATRIKYTNIMIILITTLIVIAIAFILAGIIFRPIGLLIAATRKVAAGDFSYRADVGSKDEIGTLATAFNQMLIQLEARDDALQKSQERYRRIVDTSNEGIIVLDTKQQISFANNHLAEMMGYHPDEIIGLNLDTFVFDEDLKEHSQQIHNRLLGKSDQYERRWKHHDGSAVWTIVSATPIFNDKQQFEDSFAMITDITKRKLAELQLKQQKTQLEQRNRALRQFNYAVSHELKTPLVSIESSLGLIQRTLPPTTDPELTSAFGYARTATRQMNNLLESLLLMFRIDAADTDTEATAFGVLVQDAIDQLNGGDKLEGIKVTITANGPELCGDRHKLVQIWQHLIGNAAQYIGDQKHPAIDIGVEQMGQEVLFYVRDNGMGIEQAYQGEIFEFYDQLNKTAVGTGLGLTLVQRIVDYYGGTIRVESEGLGKGSCFYFTLPDVFINKGTTT